MNIFESGKKYRFLFEELVKRDFKQKYKRTVLGMGWSLISPLLTLLVMRLVFTRFFGRNTPHYTTYLFTGTIVMSFFREATRGCMGVMMNNRGIFTKMHVPKYLFLLSKMVSSIVNFFLTLLVYFFFAALDSVSFKWTFLLMPYPIVCLMLLSLGVGMGLSAMYVFFRDTEYLYDAFLLLLHYVSAVFYTLDSYPLSVQRLFLLNPVYCIIRYMRLIVIEGCIPSAAFHLLVALHALIVLGIGCMIYRKYDQKFLYYL